MEAVTAGADDGAVEIFRPDFLLTDFFFFFIVSTDRLSLEREPAEKLKL